VRERESERVAERCLSDDMRRDASDATTTDDERRTTTTPLRQVGDVRQE